jgi:hypothetical protein
MALRVIAEQHHWRAISCLARREVVSPKAQAAAQRGITRRLRAPFLFQIKSPSYGEDRTAQARLSASFLR